MFLCSCHGNFPTEGSNTLTFVYKGLIKKTNSKTRNSKKLLFYCRNEPQQLQSSADFCIERTVYDVRNRLRWITNPRGASLSKK